MPKLTLEKAKGSSQFISGRLSIGVYVAPNNKAILIDSGIDKDTAKSVAQALQAHQLKVAAIINTHSHADHCGGNAYFQKLDPSIKIYATKYEKAFIEMPHMEPSCFSGGR